MASTAATTEFEWGECWLDPAPVPRDLAAEVRRRTGGVVPQWAVRLATVPWVVRGCARLVDKRIAHMPLRLWELISFVVSRDNSCRYCYGAMRSQLKILGYSDRTIDRLEHDVHLADLSTAEQQALEFARKVSHANPRPGPAEVEALAAAGFTRPAVAEIAYTASMVVGINRISTLFALPGEGFTRWLHNPVVRLLHPLIARKILGRLLPPEPVPESNAGPWAPVVAALAGSPAAHLLRETIDEALAPSMLPRRTKLLMAAVIERALGSARGEEDLRRALEAEGLERGTLDDLLAHLASPRLDAREAVLVPFARETVRYGNAAIQRRTRELTGSLRTEEVIEAVGIAALANGLARLSVLVERC